MDENDKFKDLNRFLETLEKSSVKSKDYIKFVIGLSTGTLVFSVTLGKEVIRNPQYQFILIIGWACLFISTILGVWILPGGDRLQSLFESLKRILAESPEKIKAIAEKKLQEYYMKGSIRKLLPPELESDERMKDFCKNLETASVAGLKDIFDKVPKTLVEKPELIPLLNQFLEELVKLAPLIKIEEQMSHPLTLFKNVRRTAWQLIYLEKVMRYSFFVGMFAILIFSIINLLR
jgi:hypothetical protein